MTLTLRLTQRRSRLSGDLAHRDRSPWTTLPAGPADSHSAASHSAASHSAASHSADSHTADFHADQSRTAPALHEAVVPRLLDHVAAVELPTAIADLADAGWLTGRPAQHWHYIAVRLDRHAARTDLRSRAAAALADITPATAGVLAALWEQEREHLRARLRAAAATAWAGLSADTTDGRALVTAVAAAGSQLAESDAVDRALTSPDAVFLDHDTDLALSSRVSDAAVERAFTHHPHWVPGLLWSASRRAFVGWAPTASGTLLFTIPAAELTTWVDGLGAGATRPLTWTSVEIATGARFDPAADWAELAGLVTRVQLLAAR